MPHVDTCVASWQDAYAELLTQVRHAGLVDVALQDLRAASERGAALDPYLLAAAQARCTLIEVSEALA
jgi:methylmalonyl-CoA mutase N-terminal domain/subunit